MVDLHKFTTYLRSIKHATSYSAIKKQLFYQSRAGSASSRMLPSFIIIGAQKAGTTSLFKYLKNHPEIQEPSRKELFFFDGGKTEGQDIFSEQGLSWYRLHFPKIQPNRPNLCTYEATTSYLFSPIAAERIRITLPEARLIAILRNPVDRAISHYQHNLRKNREFRSFHEAMRADESLLDAASSIQPGNTKTKERLYYSYKSRGLYYEQLLHYKSFLDKGQLLILCSQELAHNPAGTLQSIYDFLGLKNNKAIASSPHRHNASRQKAKPESADLEYLKQYFELPNRQLFELLGRQFAW